MEGLGATPEEWTRLRAWLNEDSERRWVPVGGGQKAPQMVEADGSRHGLKSWQEGKRAFDVPQNPHRDLGFGVCLGFGHVFAVDVDCDIETMSGIIEGAFDSIICGGESRAKRRREGSARWAALVEVVEWSDEAKKRDLPQISLSCGGAVEILGRGNHLVASGVHPSGSRNDWGEEGLRCFKATAAQMERFIEFCAALGVDKHGAAHAKAETAMAAWRGSGAVGGSRGTIERKVEALASEGKGNRHNALISARASIAIDVATEGCGVTLEEARSMLMDACVRNGYAKDEPETCRRIIDEMDTSKVKPRPEPWRDGAGGTSDRAPASEPPAEWDTVPPPTEEHASCGARIDCESMAERQLAEVVAIHGKTNEKTGEVTLDCSVSCLVECLRRPAVCGFDICFDTFDGDVRIKDFGTDSWRPCRDCDCQRIIINLERCGWKKSLAMKTVAEHVRAFATNNVRDSAVEFLDSEIPEWDGVDRSSRFFVDRCGSDDTHHARAIGRYLFAALWGRGHSPEGIKADMAVILVGPQGARKSTLVRALAFRKEWATDAIRLDDSDAAIARNIRGKLTAEIPELNGMTKRGLSELKDFLSKDVDEWTEKYQAFATRQERRCIYIMTTNERSFLADSTGNRRMGIVEVRAIDIDGIKRDLPQLWAQGRAMFEEAHGLRKWQEEAETSITSISNQYQEIDSWQEAIETWLPMHEDDEAPLTAKRILTDCIQMELDRQDRKASARVSAVMRILGYEYKVVWDKSQAKAVRCFVRK